MMPKFKCVQLIGANFDIESPTMQATPKTEHGVALFFSAVSLHPNSVQIRQWCVLARVANGAPIDCMVWEGDGENRRPIGAVRMHWIWEEE